MTGVPLYQIVSQYSGKYLDIKDGSNNVGAKVIQYKKCPEVCILFKIDGTNIFGFIKCFLILISILA